MGVNIDHVATLRNARGQGHPSITRAAETVLAAGADSITIHLREDRRHIRDADVAQLMQHIRAPLNLEMAATAEMTAIACHHRPAYVCLVPERRMEVTTEGGLNLVALSHHIQPCVSALKAAGIKVSLFIDADDAQVQAAALLGAHAIELHTGPYAAADDQHQAHALQRLTQAAALGARLGLRIHAGHGLTFDNAGRVAAIPQVEELNIGHFLVGEALWHGLDAVVRQMIGVICSAQQVANGPIDHVHST